MHVDLSFFLLPPLLQRNKYMKKIFFKERSRNEKEAHCLAPLVRMPHLSCGSQILRVSSAQTSDVTPLAGVCEGVHQDPRCWLPWALSLFPAAHCRSDGMETIHTWIPWCLGVGSLPPSGSHFIDVETAWGGPRTGHKAIHVTRFPMWGRQTRLKAVNKWMNEWVKSSRPNETVSQTEGWD